jgi:hypothetical protein
MGSREMTDSAIMMARATQSWARERRTYVCTEGWTR